MTNFSDLISQSNEKIKFIEKKIRELVSIKSSIAEANKEEEQELSKKMNNIINDIMEARGRMNKIIKDLESDINPPEEDDNQQKKVIDENELRTKKNLFNAMVKKYQRVIQKFQDEESEMKNIKETKLIRNAEIGLGRDLTKKEKEEIIEDPKMIEQIYENKLKGKAHVKLQNAVRDLEERHKDIKKLEKSIIELSKLVKYQGEMIDNIVENVSKSKDYIEKGEEQLNEAKKKKQCTKKIKCIILIGAIVGLLVIILPTVISLVK